MICFRVASRGMTSVADAAEDNSSQVAIRILSCGIKHKNDGLPNGRRKLTTGHRQQMPTVQTNIHSAKF